MLVDVAHIDAAALGVTSAGATNIIVDEFDALWDHLCRAAATAASAQQGSREAGAAAAAAAGAGAGAASKGQAQGLIRRVDVILDNAGLELYTDLVLADYLVTSGLAGGCVMIVVVGWSSLGCGEVALAAAPQATTARSTHSLCTCTPPPPPATHTHTLCQVMWCCTASSCRGLCQTRWPLTWTTC
jgi:hypothetical protein